MTRDELERALQIDSDLIGVNNRNLKTLAVDLATTEQLAPKVPKDRVLVAESGLGSPADLARMAKVGASAFLIGESFMRKPDVEAAVREMLERRRHEPTSSPTSTNAAMRAWSMSAPRTSPSAWRPRE